MASPNDDTKKDVDEATLTCACGAPLPPFTFHFDAKHEEIAKAFFAIALLLIMCPSCGRTWERELSDGTIVQTPDEALGPQMPTGRTLSS